MNDKDLAIAHALRLLWDSIESHLPEYNCAHKDERFEKDKRFHKKTIKDYLEVMKTLTDNW